MVRHGNQTIADCTRLKLHDVPTGLPLDISGLDLSFNQISKIKNNTFESFSNLTTLKMDFNNIDTIDGYAFQSFKRLRWLSMRHNHINIFSKIFDIALKSLLDLQHLDIRYNINKTMDMSKPMVYPYFGNHSFLTDLYMDIVEYPVFYLSGFKTLSKLNTIKFEQCYLNQMSNDTLVDLPSSITSIYFYGCVDVLNNPSYAKEVYSKGCQIKPTATTEYKDYSPILEKGQMVDESKFQINLPVNLTFLRVSHYMTSYRQTGQKLLVANSSKLRYVDFSYWQIKQFPEIYSDAPFNVKYMDISGLNASILIHETSIPVFQNVQTAILKKCHAESNNWKERQSFSTISSRRKTGYIIQQLMVSR
ncbi:unnamed protein product [Mytilus edulis]|uniref:Uncharacterized protein n=1 Tax=Mytilus edulis TaxID=6550 RepID=A0A8S3UAG2_MYTED|nr:unnamed protein product [Mytilus edulis]